MVRWPTSDEVAAWREAEARRGVLGFLVNRSRWYGLAATAGMSFLSWGDWPVEPGSWFSAHKGWELAAFQGFGAMSGFALASLSLVATLSTNERAKAVIDGNPGRAMLRGLLWSVWAWLIPAALALLTIAIPADVAWRWVPFFATSGLALGQGIGSLTALHLFFGRFVMPKPR